MRVDTTKTSTQGTSSGVSGGDSPRSPKASDKQPRGDGETKGAQYHCDYCRKDITSVVSIKCAECRDFDLCLECFAEGVEVYPHRNNHPYRVIDHITTPIFDDEWGADEELLLLEAIELYGLGNWSDVADHVGRTKTKAKCEAHYYEIFLNSRTAPLPDLNRPLVTRKTKKEEDAAAAAAEKEREEEEAKAKAARPKTGDLGHLVGYIPNRGDFETEYDNDAELILADMEFKEEDTKRERDLKLKIIEIYNSKLDARIERKRFILERGLLHSKEKKRTKEEREVYNNMRVFARFHTKEQHEEFVQGLINEQRLRKRIEQLQNQRLNGVRTLADGELFEAERKRREEGDRKRAELAADTSKGKGKRSVSVVESDSRAKARKTEGADAPSSTAATAAAASASSSSNAAAAAAAALPPLDLTGLEGTELLSNDEKKLCSELRLLPQHYFVVKERLIREAFLRGILKPGQARQLFKIDVNKTNKIFDFFVTVGWINTQHSAQAAAAAAAAAAPAAAGAGAGSSAYGYGRPPVLDDDAPAAASAALAAAVKVQPH